MKNKSKTDNLAGMSREERHLVGKGLRKKAQEKVTADGKLLPIESIQSNC